MSSPGNSQDPMEVPFDASAYNDPDGAANRVTLCVTPSAHMCATIAALDDWCIQALSENPTASRPATVTRASESEGAVRLVSQNE